MKREYAEKLVCPQLSGPVSYMRGSDAVTLIKTTTCITTSCVLWHVWGMVGDEHGHFIMEGDCGLRALDELNVRCDGGI